PRGRPDVVTHGKREVVLVVDRPGEPGDRPPRHHFLHEDDAATPAVLVPAPDIEAEVQLLEVAMSVNRHAANPGIEEAEPDDAHERAAVPAIELGSTRDERGEEGRIDLVVQHREVAPLRGQEWRGESQVPLLETVPVAVDTTQAHSARPTSGRRR